MAQHKHVLDENGLIDPDPFTIGLGLFQIIASGAGFLETRRRRQAVESAERGRFRGAWYNARRSLIFFKRTTDEFETYMLEGGYGRQLFRIGVVRLSLQPNQHQAMRRMHGQTMNTAQHLADDLDDLSDFLGADDQVRVDAIHDRLSQIENLPQRYRDVVTLCREAADLYNDLLDDIDERERFSDEADLISGSR